MQLFGSLTSPYVRHVRTVAIEQGQAFELVETDHAASLRASPTAKVPYLEEGAVRLYDSTAILCHLRARSASPWMSEAAQ